ncbi:UNVERIFIED_ORG: hypothetical protein DFS12_101437 [Chitinophaga ginsengisegetis]|nr:hypothetical protein [Chitinophaga ginsengisegetis]MDR6645196.1 hypothetical protein [Chitinophaga ginsengisegetis]MDR6652212.1 hypothetical protein [Chitinophaga ginsengisegetis]
MYKLIFFAPNGKLVYVPCTSLEEAREGKPYLPKDSYFGIAIPSGEVIEPAPEYDHPILIINHLKKLVEPTK